MSSLQADSLSIKSMMTEMYQVFKGQSSSAPSGSVTPTLAITHIQANIKGENKTHTATEDPLSHTEGETDVNKQENPKEPNHSTDANIEFIVLVPYTINRKLHYLTTEQIEAYMDKEEKIKKAEEEARLLVINKPKVIKVVQKEVLKRKHTEKVRKSLELRKHKYDNYTWTISSRLKLEKITDIKIYPKTKPVVITVYRGTDSRTFDVHNPFTFGDFGILELDELREIIPKKKKVVVKDLMNSLSRRYERIKKIPEELGIPSALPAPIPKQTSSKSSRRKRKHIEFEPGIKNPGLECIRTLPENVLFINNMVIKEPEYRSFFIDEFDDQVFQRWSDINKVGMEALVSYLVADSMVQSPKNARFSMKLKKLIAEHPEQEKLKSKKVKLEALRYKMY
ncbi:hypothetical protein Tco_0790970 [Tanacetum coccineum]